MKGTVLCDGCGKPMEFTATELESSWDTIKLIDEQQKSDLAKQLDDSWVGQISVGSASWHEGISIGDISAVCRHCSKDNKPGRRYWS